VLWAGRGGQYINIGVAGGPRDQRRPIIGENGTPAAAAANNLGRSLYWAPAGKIWQIWTAWRFERPIFGLQRPMLGNLDRLDCSGQYLDRPVEEEELRFGNKVHL